MIAIDWSAFSFGLAIGTVISVLFFAGLSWGMRIALQMDRPVPVLAFSAVLRIAGLLAVGWAVVSWLGPFALAGFALAFLVVRTFCVIGARLPRREGGTL